jgi:hypothetical protein
MKCVSLCQQILLEVVSLLSEITERYDTSSVSVLGLRHVFPCRLNQGGWDGQDMLQARQMVNEWKILMQIALKIWVRMRLLLKRILNEWDGLGR